VVSDRAHLEQSPKATGEPRRNARVTLAEIKADPVFAGFELARQPRLSVMPVAEVHWRRIVALSAIPHG